MTHILAPSDYGELAALFYNHTKVIGGDYPDLPYYFEKLKSKKERILEVGAGTGRFCIPLLHSGYKVEALECSPFMLKHLEKNLSEAKVKTFIHRTRAEDMTFREEFDSIIISFGSFQLFSDFKMACRCLKNFRKALKKNGTLFIDLDVIRPDSQRAGLLSYGTRLKLSSGSDILLQGSRQWDFVNQLEKVHLRYELWSQQKLERTEIQDFSLRWYGAWEFKALLKEHGFQKIEMYSDYQEEETHSDTQTLSFIAQ